MIWRFDIDLVHLTNSYHYLEMRGLNKVTLIGNLGKDPEIQLLNGHISVAKFTLATTETFKDSNGQNHSSTEWHNVVVWRSLAQLASIYLKKGHTIYLEGKIKTRNYADKTGETRHITEIIGDNLIMLDKPKKSHT